LSCGRYRTDDRAQIAGQSEYLARIIHVIE
jgi:hypothetical protein